MNSMMREPETIKQLIDSSAEKFGTKTFIRYIDGGCIYEKSYTDIRDDSYAFSRYIKEQCPEKLHIAIAGKTDYAYITVLTGTLISGNTVIPLAPDLPVDDMAQLLIHSDADMFSYDASVRDRAEEAAAQCPGVKKTFCLESAADTATLIEKYKDSELITAVADTDPADCALIMYTSGTTGKKKGVMLSMGALISNNCFKELSFTPDDITLSVLPMHHIFCFSSDYLKNIKDGVTVCLNGDLANIEKNLLLFEPTIIRLVPLITNSLFKKARLIKARFPELTPRQAAERVFGRRIRWITSSSAYLSPDTISELEEMGIKVRQAYGMTEAGPRISVPDANTSPDSVGRIISIVEVRTVNGEIQVKSPSIMMGYYKDKAATDEMITPDGWLRTGDIGKITDDRQLYITGRFKNLIILSNGENVSPEEIEKRYDCIDYIKEILVYEKNDRITADIYPDYSHLEGLTQDEILEKIKQTVYSVNAADVSTHEITAFNIVSAPLERTSSGKIIRKTV